MSDETFKHPLDNVRLLHRTNYAVWKEDCMKVLQGIMAWDIVMEREEEPEDLGRPNDFTRPLVLARKAYKDYKQRKLQAVAIIYGSCTNAVCRWVWAEKITGAATRGRRSRWEMCDVFLVKN